MTNDSLHQRAGSESYLETVAEELRRLGHELTLYAPRRAACWRSGCGPRASTCTTT